MSVPHRQCRAECVPSHKTKSKSRLSIPFWPLPSNQSDALLRFPYILAVAIEYVPSLLLPIAYPELLQYNLSAKSPVPLDFQSSDLDRPAILSDSKTAMVTLRASHPIRQHRSKHFAYDTFRALLRTHRRNLSPSVAPIPFAYLVALGLCQKVNTHTHIISTAYVHERRSIDTLTSSGRIKSVAKLHTQ